MGATPRLVDVDPDSHLLTAEIVERNLDAERALRDPGSPVRRDRRHGSDPRARPRGRGPRGRGRLPGARRALPRQAGREASARSAASASTRPRTSAPGATAGAVVTSGPKLAERVRLLRAHGEKPRYHHRLIGGTARIDALQAAVLRRKLTRLDGWNEERRRLGQLLRAALAGPRPPSGRPWRQPTSLPFDGRRPRLSPVRRSQRAARRAARAPHRVRRRLGGPLSRADPPHRRLRAARARGGQPARVRAAGRADLLAARCSRA